MFIALQIPIVDGRRFDAADRSRLAKPSWAGPRDVGREFLRSMGPVRERNAGAVDGWLSEGIYCGASRWLKFPAGGLARLSVNSQAVGLGAPVFRRWMGDGRLVFRLEIGWRVRLREPLTPHSVRLEELIRAFFATEVELRVNHTRTPVRLPDLPRRAFDGYRRSSTRLHPPPGSGASPLLRLGQVLLFLEFRAGELQPEAMTKPWKLVPLAPEYTARFRVWTARIPAGGQSIAVYCIQAVETPSATPGDVRALRINLLRMHAEIEGLDELVRWHGDPELAAMLHKNSARVNEHLEEAFKRLRPDRGLKSDPAGFRIARKALEVGGSGRIDLVLEEVRLRITDPSARLRGILHALHRHGGIDNLSIDMSNQSTSNTTTISGNITGSSISTAQAGAHGNATATATLDIQGAREALATLDDAVTKTLPHVADEDLKSELQSRLKDLKKEGKDRKWYEVSAEGLMDAAKAVGAIAAPIVSATTAFLAILG